MGVISAIKRRPAAAIKLTIMILIFIGTFIYIESVNPSRSAGMEFMALIGGALIGAGIDAFIIYFERFHFVCEDI